MNKLMHGFLFGLPTVLAGRSFARFEQQDPGDENDKGGGGTSAAGVKEEPKKENKSLNLILDDGTELNDLTEEELNFLARKGARALKEEQDRNKKKEPEAKEPEAKKDEPVTDTEARKRLAALESERNAEKMQRLLDTEASKYDTLTEGQKKLIGRNVIFELANNPRQKISDVYAEFAKEITSTTEKKEKDYKKKKAEDAEKTKGGGSGTAGDETKVFGAKDLKSGNIRKAALARLKNSQKADTGKGRY